MAWTIIRSGPYIENLSQFMAPTIDTDETYLFKLPLDDGALHFIYLQDFRTHVHWAISNMEQSNGLDFGIATAHVAGRDIASSFTATTGMSARYVSLPIEVWHANTWMKLPRGVDTMVGFLSINDDGALLQTYGENFTNWWNLYKASSGNTGLMRGD